MFKSTVVVCSIEEYTHKHFENISVGNFRINSLVFKADVRELSEKQCVTARVICYP